MADELERALSSLGLSALYGRFVQEKVDGPLILSMGEKDLINLGVAHMGDRLRLKEIIENQNKDRISLSTRPQAQSSSGLASGKGSLFCERIMTFSQCFNYFSRNSGVVSGLPGALFFFSISLDSWVLTHLSIR